MKRLVSGFLVLAPLCSLGYMALRQSTIERWEKDGRNYVIFPEGSRFLYLLFRPASYADQALTGTGAHIGPHREVEQ